MGRLLNPANLLTLSRVLLTPLVAGSILRKEHSLALALLAVAGASDAVDGVLARRFGWSTRLGAYFDPIADKILLVASYIALWAAGLIPWWLLMIVVGRDVLILVIAGAALLWTKQRRFDPSVWGKLSTLVQILTGVIVIGNQAAPWAVLASWADVLPTLAATTTAWSGVHYAWRAAQLWGETGGKKED